MDDLAEHIQQTFSAFMGYEEADIQLTLWCIRKVQDQREAAREYRWRNAAKVQQAARERYWRDRDAALARQYAWKLRSGYDSYKYTKAWRRANPEKFRAMQAEQTRRYRAKHPDKARAAKQRYRDKHREHVREVNRRNQAARRARLKAQKQGEAA